MASANKLYTLSHPRLRNVTIASPLGDGSNVFVDSTGHVRNVPSLVAAKLAQCGYTLLGSDAGLIAFEARVAPYVDACIAMGRARSVFERALNEALGSGVALEELDEVVARHPRADLVNLRALLGEAPAPAAPVAPVKVAAPPLKVAPVAEAPEPAAEPAAAAEPDVAAEPEAEADPLKGLHWRAVILVAKHFGAELPEGNGAVVAAREFLADKPADDIRAAIASLSAK